MLDSAPYSQKKAASIFTLNKTISPLAGFVTGWLWIFESLVVGATVSIGLASYVIALFPMIALVIARANEISTLMKRDQKHEAHSII